MQYPTRYRVTPREYEVWELLAHAASYKDVARVLGLKYYTVKDYITTLYRKVGVLTVGELIVVWYGGELLRDPVSEVVERARAVQPTPLKERATLFPTGHARQQATGEPHPWRRDMVTPRGDVLPA